MKITIHSNRPTITLEVSVTDSIEQLKEKIFEKLGYPIDQQKLFFNNKELQDIKSLSNYSLGSECELYLEIKMRIFVKMCTTQKELDCFPSMSINELKQEISKKVPIQPNRQVLSFEERELMNTQTVRDCKLKDNVTIILTGVISVSAIFSSGKSVSLLFEQSAHVFGIKEEVHKKDCILPALLTLYYKGRVLREDQTFACINYREEESISLVVKQSERDMINIFVKKPNGEKQLISINKYDPIGKIEDTVYSDVDSLFSHFCCYNEKCLDDMDMLSTHRIQPMSEVELRYIDVSRVSVSVSLLNGYVSSFYVLPTELVADVKSRIRSKLGTDNEQRNLFYGQKKLRDDLTMRECEISPGAHLLLGCEDSFSVTIHPGFKSFEILAQNRDKIKDLKKRIRNRERIPIELQVISFEGRELQNEQLVNFTIHCGSIISLTIQQDHSQIGIKLIDLAGNSTSIAKVSTYITVENFITNLSNSFPISKQDMLAFQSIIMKPARLLCSYEITEDSEVQIVSMNTPGMLSPIPPPAPARHTQMHMQHGYADNQRPTGYNYNPNQPPHYEPYHQPPPRMPIQPIQIPHNTHMYNQSTHLQQSPHPYYPPPSQTYNVTPQHVPSQQPVSVQQNVPFSPNVPVPQPGSVPQYTNYPQAAQPQPQSSHLQSSYRLEEQETRSADPGYEQAQADNVTSSLPPHFNPHEPRMGRQQSARRLPDTMEFVIYITHPTAGMNNFQCTPQETVFMLKEKVSRQLSIPLGKIQLTLDDTLLSHDTKTLGAYGVYHDRIIKLINLICVYIHCQSKQFIRWMNSSDLVSFLATEVAGYMAVQQDSVRLSCSNGVMDFRNSLSSYPVESLTGVTAELL